MKCWGFWGVGGGGAGVKKIDRLPLVLFRKMRQMNIQDDSKY